MIAIILGAAVSLASGEEKRAAGKFPALKEVQSRIEALRVDDVAWRKIAWKTCLLDGLAASRKEDKPVILWVFIDRPVDDKRC